MLRDDIRLSLTAIEPMVAIELLDIFGSSTALFAASKEEILARSRFNEKNIKKLFDIISDERIDSELEFIEKYSIKTHSVTDSDYPIGLSTIPDAPLTLYSKGDFDLTESSDKWIAIVGTRKCSAYGMASTERIVEEIARNHSDAVIVSGLAYGIDSCAHRAALKYGLKTTAVVAHGLNTIYPSDHRDLAKKIIETGGAIVTEYPSDTFVTKYSFLRRNRIIAALSSSLILSESPDKGGAMFTARLADEYGRDVFTFPARTIDKSFEGNLKLLRDHNAHLLFSAEDIEREMVWQKSEKKERDLFSYNSIILTNTEEQILEFITNSGECSIDELTEECSLPMIKIMSSLTSLEIKRLIKATRGKMYVRC